MHVGFGSDKATRHRMPSGFYKFTVHNVKELECLLMQNRKCVAHQQHHLPRAWRTLSCTMWPSRKRCRRDGDADTHVRVAAAAAAR